MRTTVFRTLAWILIAAISTLSLVPPFLRPTTGVPHHLEHFAIYALCGYAFGVGYRSRHLLQAMSLVAFSGAVEFLQLLAPGRHARMADFVVDAGASCAGVLIGLITIRLSSGIQENSTQSSG
jgi:VanZ family protein